MAIKNKRSVDAVRIIDVDEDAGTITYSHGNIGHSHVDEIVNEFAVPGYTGLREDDGSDRPVVRITTFGNFSISIDDKPVVFVAKKGAEYIANLVDAQGTPIDKSIIKSRIYEEEYAKGVSESALDTRFRGLKKSVNDQLKELGIGFIIQDVGKGRQIIDVSKLKCDLYEFLRYGENSNVEYYGSYLEDFSWGHETPTATQLDRKYNGRKANK